MANLQGSIRKKVGASIRSCGVQKVRMIYFCYSVVVSYSDDSTAQDNFTAELAIHIFVLQASYS